MNLVVLGAAQPETPESFRLHNRTPSDRIPCREYKRVARGRDLVELSGTIAEIGNWKNEPKRVDVFVLFAPLALCVPDTRCRVKNGTTVNYYGKRRLPLSPPVTSSTPRHARDSQQLMRTFFSHAAAAPVRPFPGVFVVFCPPPQCFPRVCDNPKIIAIKTRQVRPSRAK